VDVLQSTMTVEEAILYRRSTREFDAEKEISTEKVKRCLELASLAPNSSNMQLWEFYHVTDKETMKSLTRACLDQNSMKTAKEVVVFVTRQDLFYRRSKEMLKLEYEDIERYSPEDRKEPRRKNRKRYYGFLMPFLYARFVGLLGVLRKIIASVVGLFQPMTREVSEEEIYAVVHKSCALAAQNFMIAMAGQGYDTCPLEGFDSKMVKKILDLPYGSSVNMIIPCGIRTEAGVRRTQLRVPFEEVYKRI
jgi:nitroreductase